MTTNLTRELDTRQVPPAVEVECWWIEIPSTTELAEGTARCVIATPKTAGNYSLGVIWDDDNFDILGWRLVPEHNPQESYDLPATLDACECGDFRNRNRPGGCKHIRAMRRLLAEIGFYDHTEG